MGTTPFELAGQFCSIDPTADPHVVALEVARTGDHWFDGISPAVGWAMVWVERAGQPAGIRRSLRRSIEAGYRHGRLLLGTGLRPHPDTGHEELTDVVAELLCTLAIEAATEDLFDTLPPVVAATHDRIALLVAVGFAGADVSLERRRELCRLSADLGLVLAGVEHQLDAMA